MWLIYLMHILVRVMIPLIIGGIIYILFGDESIRLVNWSMEIDALAYLRNQCSSESIPEWLIFNIPDGIWLFALLQFIDIVWSGEEGSHIWIALSVLLAIGHELGQLASIFSGTFDVLDLLLYGIVAICSILLNRHLRR